MGPPQDIVKRKNAGCMAIIPEEYNEPSSQRTLVAEPQPKRKTLTERGGEPLTSKLAAPATGRTIDNAARSNLMNGTRSAFSNSTSKLLPTSNATRHTSSSRMGTSVGHPRAASQQSMRTKSSLNHSRSASQYARPTTAAKYQEEEVQDDRKGRRPLFISPFVTPINLKVHKPPNGQEKQRIHPAGQKRSVSDNATHTSSKSFLPVPSSPGPCTPTHMSFAEVADPFNTRPPLRGTRSFSDVLTTSSRDLMRKSAIPIRSPSLNLKSIKEINELPGTPRKPRKKRGGSPSKATPYYANKYTNEPAPVFDTVGRLENMEQQFEQLRKQMEGTTSQRESLQETIDILKGRGM